MPWWRTRRCGPGADRVGKARGWIQYIGTIASARRGGVCHALLDAGLACLVEHGAHWAECLIDSDNAPSIALHAQYGFHATGTCADSYYAALGLPGQRR